MSAIQLEFQGNLTNSRRNDPDVVELLSQVPTIDVQLERLGKLCAQRNPNVGQYVGTAAAARDMLALTESVDGAGSKVNYWGISYVLAVLFR